MGLVLRDKSALSLVQYDYRVSYCDVRRSRGDDPVFASLFMELKTYFFARFDNDMFDFNAVPFVQDFIGSPRACGFLSL